MATKTAIQHKGAAAQERQFYPYTVKVNGFDASGNPSVLLESIAAYEPKEGANPATFEGEAPASDRILLPEWRQECAPKQTVILSKGAWRKRFEISDVLPNGTKTLLVVTPERT